MGGQYQNGPRLHPMASVYSYFVMDVVREIVTSGWSRMRWRRDFHRAANGQYEVQVRVFQRGVD
jgi:hypothetical protein